MIISWFVVFAGVIFGSRNVEKMKFKPFYF